MMLFWLRERFDIVEQRLDQIEEHWDSFSEADRWFNLQMTSMMWNLAERGDLARLQGLMDRHIAEAKCAQRQALLDDVRRNGT